MQKNVLFIAPKWDLKKRQSITTIIMLSKTSESLYYKYQSNTNSGGNTLRILRPEATQTQFKKNRRNGPTGNPMLNIWATEVVKSCLTKSVKYQLF